MAWHPQQRRLIPSKDPPLEASALLQILSEIREHLKDQTSVLRFHSLRKLAADAELQAEAVYPWLLTVSPALHASMAKISYHSAWQLVSIDLKRDRQATRSPLAKTSSNIIGKKRSLRIMPQQTSSFLLVKCYCIEPWMVGFDSCIST